jgi:hypothetical protein
MFWASVTKGRPFSGYIRFPASVLSRGRDLQFEIKRRRITSCSEPNTPGWKDQRSGIQTEKKNMFAVCEGYFCAKERSFCDMA